MSARPGWGSGLVAVLISVCKRTYVCVYLCVFVYVYVYVFHRKTTENPGLSLKREGFPLVRGLAQG